MWLYKCPTCDEIIPEPKVLDELRVVLKEAIDAIEVFHGPGWELYRDHSPEMKRWKALLQ